MAQSASGRHFVALPFMPLEPPIIRRRVPPEPALPLRLWLKQLPEPALLLRGVKIVSLNEASCELLGADEAILCRRSLLAQFSVASASVARRGLTSLRHAGAVWRAIDQQLLHVDGSMRLVDVTAVAVSTREPASRLILLHDVTDRHQRQVALSRAQLQLRQLALGWDAAQEQERHRIAQELHNDLMQSLAAVRMELDAISERLPPSDGWIEPLLARVGDLALSAMDSTRRIVNGLQPPMLEDLGLEAALEALLGNFSRRTGQQCVLFSDMSEVSRSDSASVNTCLYRVLETCLDNLERRPGVTRIDVRLSQGVDGRLVMTVHDDGPVGDEPASDAATVSVLGMQERLRAVGGSLVVVAAERHGTTVEAAIPGVP